MSIYIVWIYLGVNKFTVEKNVILKSFFSKKKVPALVLVD